MEEKDELFCLRASLHGPAGQLLWDLGPQVTLADLIRLLRKRFGTMDQAEQYCNELQTRHRRDGEMVQELYNNICHLMSLVYPGPTTDLCNAVGRDAFLEALGNPSLRVRILQKVLTTKEEAQYIALNLEALDKSKEAEAKAMGGSQDKVVEELSHHPLDPRRLR